MRKQKHEGEDDDTNHLQARVALVTGASSGIGAATAVALAAAGATVAIAARRVDRLAELVAQIEAAGGKALALPGDMTVEADAMQCGGRHRRRISAGSTS